MSVNEINTAQVISSVPDAAELDLTRDVRFFGRTYTEGGTHFFNWSASGFTFSFRGSGAEAEIVSSAPGGKDNAYLKIYVDGREQEDVLLSRKTQKLTLAAGLDPAASHTVTVLKRTNARSSAAGITALRLTDGEKLPPEPAKERRIEFIGDSLTVGYAASLDALSESAWSTATEDVTGTYVKTVADALKCEYSVCAISGRGIVRNNGGTTDRLLPLIYPKLDDYNLPGVPYDFADQPNVIVINLGTNDASGTNPGLSGSEVQAGAAAFLRLVREKNPGARIIWAYGLTTVKFSAEIEAAVRELNEAGDDRIRYLALKKCDPTEKHLGHTSRSAYGTRADQIIGLICELTGWRDPRQTEK